MSKTPKSPETCQTMSEVRTGVDSVDRDLITLLGTRFGYMEAAARIKQDRDTVRDEKRKAAVIENAKKTAWAAGVPIGFIDEFWDKLVETSIAYELEKWDALRK
ncbi:chorismate mutase [Sphingorhabdus sp. Alg239-R122]|uniref:chorismate mutase n=1 Tax=Sphingorhabdus sp. Alg239-R122 TaxID=2305989 RepID=UPI0013DA178A|nr:chorismate mutase [Sphingorhabdus sp. Alg239-R122]